MASGKKMIPRDEIETKASMAQLKELVSFLYDNDLCRDDPLTMNLGIMGGWAVFFTVNGHWKDWRKHEYYGSRDIDIFVHCEEDRLEKMFKAIEDLGYWVKDGRGYVKVLRKDPHEPDGNRSKVIPKKEYHRISPEDRIEHYLDIFCDRFCGDSALDCRFKIVNSLLDLQEIFPKSIQIQVSGKRIALPPLIDLIKLKARAMFDEHRGQEKILKDMCDIIALSTVPTFQNACMEHKDSLGDVEMALSHIRADELLKQVSINLFNEDTTEYITGLIDNKLTIIHDLKSKI